MKKDKYSKRCQTINKYPKVITDDKKNYIDGEILDKDKDKDEL